MKKQLGSLPLEPSFDGKQLDNGPHNYLAIISLVLVDVKHGGATDSVRILSSQRVTLNVAEHPDQELDRNSVLQISFQLPRHGLLLKDGCLELEREMLVNTKCVLVFICVV